jgi:hypothetical protein
MEIGDPARSHRNIQLNYRVVLNQGENMPILHGVEGIGLVTRRSQFPNLIPV